MKIQEQDTAKMVNDAYNAVFKTGTNDVKKILLENIDWNRCQIVKEESIHHIRLNGQVNDRIEVGRIMTISYHGNTSLPIDEIDAQNTVVFKAFYCGGGIDVRPIGFFYNYNEAVNAVELYAFSQAVDSLKNIQKGYANHLKRMTPPQAAEYLENLEGGE